MASVACDRKVAACSSEINSVGFIGDKYWDSYVHVKSKAKHLFQVGQLSTGTFELSKNKTNIIN